MDVYTTSIIGTSVTGSGSLRMPHVPTSYLASLDHYPPPFPYSTPTTNIGFCTYLQPNIALTLSPPWPTPYVHDNASDRARQAMWAVVKGEGKCHIVCIYTVSYNRWHDGMHMCRSTRKYFNYIQSCTQHGNMVGYTYMYIAYACIILVRCRSSLSESVQTSHAGRHDVDVWTDVPTGTVSCYITRGL